MAWMNENLSDDAVVLLVRSKEHGCTQHCHHQSPVVWVSHRWQQGSHVSKNSMMGGAKPVMFPTHMVRSCSVDQDYWSHPL